MKRKRIFSIVLVLTVILLTCLPLCSSAVQVKSHNGQTDSSVENSTEENLTPVYAEQITEGTYSPSVTSSSSMFRVTGCSLTVADGNMTARITLGGTAYSYLYMGTDSEAAEAGEDEWIPYEENADGSYSYTIPVEALDKEIDCAAFSTRSSKWFPRTLVFEASSLPEGSVQEVLSSDSSSSGSDSSAGTEASSSSKKDQYKKASSAKDSALGYAEAGMADGEYKIKVTLSGGSGRASIESPAVMTVKDGHATATIIWSSPNYDYMIVNGLLYEPVNKKGNSTFEIPVTKFDGGMKVTADTTAMSQPYEIDYVLDFDSDQAELQGMSVRTKGLLLLLIIVLVIVAGFIRGRLRSGKSDYDLRTADEVLNQSSSSKPVSRKKKKLR